VTSLAHSSGSGAAGVARRFLDSLAAQEFDQLRTNLADDVRLRALLPGDTLEWEGAERVTRTFVRWFGDTQDFELVDATLDDLGRRLHMSWCARVRAERLGEGWFRVEQQGYAETDEHDLIRHLWLACSGYLEETPAR
jgi:hypothetical protein